MFCKKKKKLEKIRLNIALRAKVELMRRSSLVLPLDSFI